MLDLERIGTCPARVLEGSPKVLHGAGMILLLKALGCPLQPQGAKIDKLAVGLVTHKADIGRAQGDANFSQRI